MPAEERSATNKCGIRRVGMMTRVLMNKPMKRSRQVGMKKALNLGVCELAPVRGKGFIGQDSQVSVHCLPTRVSN